MRILNKIILFAVTACLLSITVFSQKPNSGQTNTQKFKPPRLYSSLGSYRDSSSITVAEAERIISLPLKIVDDKKMDYKVTSYQFMYKRKAVTEDEKTGKVSPTTSISADRFTGSPLPELWIKTIRERVTSGEELFFFDIIVKDNLGRLMYAPNIRIQVK